MNRIRELRKSKGLSIEKLSKELKSRGINISASAISQYERGKRKPKIETWQKLANFFNVTVPYIQGISKIKEVDELENLVKLSNTPINKLLKDYPGFLENPHKYSIFKEFDEEEQGIEEVTALKRFDLYKKAYESNNGLIDEVVSELSIKEMTEICALLDEVFDVALGSFKDDKFNKLAYEAVQKIRDVCDKYFEVKLND